MIYRFYRLRPAIKELSLWWSVKPKDLDTSPPLAAQINFPFETLAPPCRKYHPWGRRCPKETSLSYVTLALASALYVQWSEGDHTRSRNAREGCWNHQWNSGTGSFRRSARTTIINKICTTPLHLLQRPPHVQSLAVAAALINKNNFKRP